MVFNDEFPEDTPSQKVIGSFGSWLILLDINGEILCRDSDSEAKVSLPRLPEFPDVEEQLEFSENQRAYCYYRVHNQYDYPQKFSPRQMRDWYVKKLVLSSSPLADCIAFAVTRSGTQLAYCRRGDKSWSSVPLSFVPDAHRSTEDAVYYNGVFVALSSYRNQLSGIREKEYTICDLSVPHDPVVTHHPKRL